MNEEFPTQVTIELPATIAHKAAEVAKRNQWSFEQTVVFLAERGLAEQEGSEANLRTAYEQFMTSSEAEEDEAGKGLIRAALGPDSIAIDGREKSSAAADAEYLLQRKQAAEGKAKQG